MDTRRSNLARPAMARARARVRLTGAVAVLTLLAIAGSVVAFNVLVTQSRTRARVSVEIARLAQETAARALDGEAAVRGYLLTGDPAALAPYRAARAATDVDLDSLGALTAGDPPRHQLALAISAALDRWDRGFAAPAIAGRQSSGVPSRGFVRTPTGRAQFDTVRSAIAQFLTAEDSVHVARLREVDATQRTATAATLIEIAILAAIVVLLGRRIGRQTDLLEASGRELSTYAHDLESQAVQLEEQAVELEQQNEEAQTLASRLEATNEGLQQALAEADRARATLSTERQFLRQVIDVNPNFVFAKDRAGRFTLVNRAVADVYGTTIEQLIGRTDADFNANPEEVDAFRRDDLAVIETLEARSVPEERITDASGAVRWVQTVKCPIVGPDGRADQVLGVSTDITDRKRLEAQLLQAQKIEAVGRLAGGVAHDFNNLLTVITSYTGLLLDQLDTRDPLREDVVEIKKAADRAARLTSQLLAFSRKQIAVPRVLDVNTVIADLDTMLRRLISEDIELGIVTGPDHVFVRADPGQVEQVIVNLAVNARDAMPSGGRLSIEVSTVWIGAEAGRRLFPPPPGEYVLITVSDTGLGMDADTMSHIFEPFFTTKPPGKGTGLGLSTVYGIVKQAAGDVRVQSQPGQGTRIRIFLPRIAGPDAIPQDAVDARPPAPKEGGTILLVEDDAALCALARRVLTGVGYQVLAASNGAEAIALSEQYGGEIDLIATDVVMPGMSGSALVEQILATRPAARVLYMSGYTDDDVVRRGIVGGTGCAFLQKPFTPDVLLKYVRDALGASAMPRGAAPPPGPARGGAPRRAPTPTS